MLSQRVPVVLFVIGNLDVGGAERHLAEVLPGIKAEGLGPIVYVLTHRGPLASVLVHAGIEVFGPPFASVVRKLPSVLRPIFLLPITGITLWRLMRRVRPDIVHFFLPAAYLVGGICSLTLGVKARVMSRRSLNNYQRRHPILRSLEFWLHRHMRAVLGNSRAVVAQLAQEGVPADSLGLIYNGIDLNRLASTPARDVVRETLGIGKDVLVITAVANLISYKGHGDLLRAVAGVREQLGDDWVLLCVGRDDGVRRSLEAKAVRLGITNYVRWLGERKDVPAILRASDLCVLASHQEGFSNSVLEAMAAGLPLVVTDVGGNREAVLDGITGIVVPARNPDILGQAIATLGNNADLRRRMGNAGKRRIQSEFPVSRCVLNYVCLYRGLLKHDKRPVREILCQRSSDVEQ